MAIAYADPLAALGCGAVDGRYSAAMQSANASQHYPALYRPPWAIVLGVEAGASEGDIKRAYHALAVINHPDHGGSQEAMVAINNAFEQAMWAIRPRTA